MGSVSGYDSLKLNHSLLLDLRMREGTGTLTRDWSDAHYALTWHVTPTWTNTAHRPSTLTLAAGDYFTIPGADTAAFDFTTEDFSLVTWAYITNYSSARCVFNRGVLDTCGWEWYCYDGNLAIRTNQAGSRCGATGINCLSLNAWLCLAFARQGTYGQMYVDGQRVYTLQGAGGLLDPVGCGAQTLYIGSNPHANNYLGQLWRPRIWSRRLSDGEVRGIWNREKAYWGR